MSAEPQIVRQWLILRQLSSHRLGLTVRALADELHVTEKTIRRDLETLQGVGFGMKETVGEHGRKSFCVSTLPTLPTPCRV